ncbi:MAG: transketolase [Lachnospiraceae bacterium]|nr:transketolase [Lachnospiraceae bacterium]
MNETELAIHANEIRKGIIRSVHAAKAGHPGGSLSSADILTYLYFEEMKNIDPADPSNPERDRLVLSKGHAAPVLYATLAEKGFFPKEELLTLRKIGSRLQGHPDMNLLPGVDMSTGSLGQGLSTAVGMALAGKMDQKDYRVYAVVGDGEIQEGQIWEACMFAGHRKLDNLVVILDNNGLQIDGDIAQVCSPYPLEEKFASFNFHVIHADAHDFHSLAEAFAEARETKGMPTAVIAKSIKGKGVSFMENNAGWHGKAPNDEEFEIAMKDLENIGAELCRSK